MSAFTTSDPRTTVEIDPHAQFAEYHIAALDICMSGWGKASEGNSYAVWACNQSQVDRIQKWVESRSEMKSVRIVQKSGLTTRPGDHVHVYFVNDTHPALAEGNNE